MANRTGKSRVVKPVPSGPSLAPPPQVLSSAELMAAGKLLREKVPRASTSTTCSP